MISKEILHIAKILELKAKQKTDHTLSGKFKSTFMGQGLDFKDVREYYPGDEVRRIDWNVTARIGSPYIKTFHEDKSLNLIVIADISPSMDFGNR